MPAGYEIDNSSAVALTGGTARTALLVMTPAQFGMILKRFAVAFDGTTTLATGYVELVRSSNASNVTPGTNNTNESANITQSYGRPITVGFTALGAAAAGFEPTALTVIRRFMVSPSSSTVIYDYPLGTEPDAAPSSGLGIRINMPASVNAHVSMEVERI